MLVYWLLFAFFAVGAFLEKGRAADDRRPGPMLVLGGAVIALLIGFRYEVGADWDTYEFMFAYVRHVELDRAMEVGEPAYQLLNWGAQQVDADLWLVNLVGGAIFAWGLVRFAQAQANPWLAMLVAVPYLVIVVGMGYSRQAVALGLLMAGLASVERRGSIVRFALYVAAAAMFHRTAVVAFPLVAFSSSRNRIVNILIGVSASLFFYDLFLGDAMETFVKNYIEAEYSSQGAAIRVAMSVVAATLYLLFKRRFAFPLQQHLIWRNFSLAAFGLLVLLIVLPSSTAVDRLALYIIPLQVAVLARVPGTLMNRLTGKIAIIGYSFAVQFVWLNFAAHAEYWVPYQTFPV